MQIAYNIVCSKDAILIVWLIEGSSKSHFNLSTILVFGIIRLLAKNIFCIHTLETGNDDRLTHRTAFHPGGFRKCCRENGLNNICIFGLFYPSQWKELWQLFKNLTPGINNIIHKETQEFCVLVSKNTENKLFRNNHVDLCKYCHNLRDNIRECTGIKY